jgi:hypothetical protein
MAEALHVDEAVLLLSDAARLGGTDENLLRRQRGAAGRNAEHEHRHGH